MKSLIREESGTYSLEAALVLPVILVIIAVMILFTGYTYQKTVLYGAAVVNSERTASIWDNSHRDARSGLAAVDEYDSLYWRFGEDGMLQSLFGLSGSRHGEASAVIGSESDYSLEEGKEEGARHTGSLAERKLARSAELLSGASTLQGEIFYERGAVTRTIMTRLRMPGEAASLQRWLGRSEPASAATAVIVEPTEFIRTIDLVRYYTAKFGNGSGSTAQLQQAGRTVQKTAGKSAHG